MDLEHGSGSSKHSRTHEEAVDRSGSSKHSRIHEEAVDGSGSSKHSRTNEEIVEGSGSSKHSRTHEEFVDGSGSSQRSRTHEEIVDGSASSEHSVPHPEVIDGSGSSRHSSTHAEEIVDGSVSSKHSTTDPEVIDGSGSSKHSATHLEATVDGGDQHSPAKKLVSFSSASSSSSSSDSSLEDFFQVNTNDTAEFRVGTTAFFKPNKDVLRAEKDDKNDVSSDSSSCKSEEPDNVSTGPTTSSQVSDPTIESVAHCMSPPQFPPIQVMEQSEGYDPNRIPSSVFERSKSSTPMEWSVASNESLFSIHVGNNSFSRDHVLLFGGDLYKSGELIVFSPPPPVTMVESGRKSVDMGKDFGAAGVAEESSKDATKLTTDDQSEAKIRPPAMSWNSSSISNHSDGSGGSTQSFAFPILAEGIRNGSLKAKIEQQEAKENPQTPTSRASSYFAFKKWFLCFFHCPRCSFSCCYCF